MEKTMENSNEKIAAQLLNRPLNKRDGFSLSRIQKAEARLGFALPSALRDFYLTLGNNERFSQSFSRFVAPEDLEISHGKLIFLCENQDVCYWAIDANIDYKNQQPTVYQTNTEGKFFSEKIDLQPFIRINLYYQLAQGGYAYCATIDADDKDTLTPVLQLLDTDKSWEKVVDYNHLVIYCKQSQLIWYLTDQNNEISEMIFASTLHRKDLHVLIRDFGFDDLG
jgi:hypothetical protein